MSVKLYDDALLNKLKTWIKDENMTITSPNETRRLFSYKADITNDEPLKLPLIALRRDTTITVLNTNKKPSTYDGMTFRGQLHSKNGQLTNQGKTQELNVVPINLNYQIDIYTRYEEEALEYVRNFVFNIINFPKLQIEIPYNSANIIHNSNIRLSNDIQDNSDIPERLIPGQFTRYTISLFVDDCYLWDYKTKDIKTLDDVEVQTRLKSEVF